MKLQVSLPSGEMTFTAVKLTKRAVPKFVSGKRGRTWDCLMSLVIDGETLKAWTDSTWGSCHYFKYKDQWYMIRNRQNVYISTSEPDKFKLLDFYAFDDLGYNCPAEIIKE